MESPEVFTLQAGQKWLLPMSEMILGIQSVRGNSFTGYTMSLKDKLESKVATLTGNIQQLDVLLTKQDAWLVIDH